ncbi:MAG: hypothetical protein ABJB85_10545 [Nitrososphaerota archaeon]
MMQYKFIILPVVIGLLLPSIAIPWIIVNLFGYHAFSPLTILEELFGKSAAISQNQILLLDITSSYKDTYLSIILSIILYVISIPTIITSLLWKKQRSVLFLVVSAFAISSGLIMLYAVESFRTNFSHQAASTGGLIGEEWKGKESTLVNRIIGFGSGQYFVITSGIVALTGWLLEKIELRRDLRSDLVS